MNTRDEIVVAQYDTDESVARYADLHSGDGPAARFFASRIHAVLAALADRPGGDLLDVGCGPGVMVRKLLDARGGDFRITAVDSSPAMVHACARQASARERVRTAVGRIEQIPFPDNAFDVVLAMGVLEYTDLPQALAEIARVARPGGLVLVTMLNPVSPYRFVQWHVHWPLLRFIAAAQTLLRVPLHRRRQPPSETGIVAYRARTLRRMLTAAGLHVDDTVYFDATLSLPPLEKIARRFAHRWRTHPERTVSRGPRRLLGSAYLVAASKQA